MTKISSIRLKADSGSLILMEKSFHVFTDTVLNKVEEMQQPQSLVEDSSADTAVNSGLGKTLVAEDELKSPYALDAAVCGRYLFFVTSKIYL